MENTFNKLDNTFNITEVDIDISPSSSEFIIQSDKDDITTDYEYTRNKYYQILERGNEALNSALEVAQNTDHPRAYEVVGQLLKHNADIVDKLLDLQKKLRELNTENNIKNSTTITNNSLFVGSTAELQKLLKSQKNKNE